MGHEDLIEHARMQLRGHNLPDAVADLLKLAEHHGRMLEAYAANSVVAGLGKAQEELRQVAGPEHDIEALRSGVGGG